ncbi:uncharacterized protein [Drosophila bipectinata]|uniref:uncharacterized protein n=1 Tax=Drosophila bipectinata TaxID=42026 RepID=UPI001C8902A6|nr:uncharacterized protein LOC108127277 [Drosophila bipectinata]
MKFHLILISIILSCVLVKSQVLIPGLRVRQIPVLTNGQIQPVPYLEQASTVTPDSVREQFSRRGMTLAKPLVSGTPAQAKLPDWPNTKG